jgi:plasmid stabilization system protein ParE
MRVVYTAEALRDLDEILAFIGAHYPAIAATFLRRLEMIERRLARWPESAEEVEQRPGVRVVPFIRYPYKLFYQVRKDAIEILHVHHAARRDPWDDAD